METVIDFSDEMVKKFISKIPNGISVATSQRGGESRGPAYQEKMRSFNKAVAEAMVSSGAVHLNQSSDYFLIMSDFHQARLEDLPANVQLQAVTATINALGENVDKIKQTISFIEEMVKSASFIDVNTFRSCLIEHVGNGIANISFLALRLKKCIAEGDLKNIFSNNWLFERQKKRKKKKIPKVRIKV